ncbi:monovalent cation/H(+) antiporter subunit G [Desulfuribacillus stibiiarsenatis]|uniref:monovalent cation/H(+) antiporter subunit G n=1 Tax=Desulfuribacillus stibiiarsenatis TaxID=1390249 RepID=UPI0009F59A3E|nr:monovalent cation/H(+) antiporter subunit G [Desulfuribacillus stibiiarsenatis]
MTEIVISFLILFGVFFILVGSIGVARLPDVYTRLHAPTKAATLGIIGLLLASLMYFLVFENHGESTGVFAGKHILTIIFIFVTAPVGAHMLTRAAYIAGEKKFEGTCLDELEGRYPKAAQGEACQSED